MSQIRGTAGYHLGPDNRPFGGPSMNSATSDPSPLDTIRAQTSKIEDLLDTFADPVKPYAFGPPRAVKDESANSDLQIPPHDRSFPDCGNFLRRCTANNHAME